MDEFKERQNYKKEMNWQNVAQQLGTEMRDLA